MPPIYMDCNATTPIDPRVLESLQMSFLEIMGNAGSRTHEFGIRAKQAVQKARDQIASVVAASRDEVIFTSGATESNNLVIRGLLNKAKELNKKHFITSAIEHKAVLEPFESLRREGINLTILPVGKSGRVDPEAVRQSLRSDTFLVSIMQVNNETGVCQPLEEIATILEGCPVFFHTDAAQGFGKNIDQLRNPRIDLISISGHKIFAPQGIGALVMRRRNGSRPPISPLMYGGGQERGIRPGTLPVPLIIALGAASELALRDAVSRRKLCIQIRKQVIEALKPLNPIFTGDQSFVMEHVINFAIPGLDSEALILALKDQIAISNGSACTSNSYSPSHVLKSMGMTDEDANSCVRISWCHLTPKIDWNAITDRIRKFL
jgi:cysteine desulfurase